MLIPRPTFQYLRTYMSVQLCMTPEKYRRYIWGIRSSSMVIIVESRSLDRVLYYFYLMNYSWWSWMVMWCILSSDSTGWRGLVSWLLTWYTHFLSVSSFTSSSGKLYSSFIAPSIAHAGMHISWDLDIEFCIISSFGCLGIDTDHRQPVCNNSSFTKFWK